MQSQAIPVRAIPQNKIERLLEVTEEILSKLPTSVGAIAKVYLNSYRQQLDNLPEEAIDELILSVRQTLDYIETGEK